MERAATVVRQTKETNIELTLGLDGGEVVVDTGVGIKHSVRSSSSAVW